jgi:hypothetical protein
VSRALKNLALLVSSTLIAVLVAEVLCRVTGIGPKFGELFAVRGILTRTVDGVPLWSEKDPRYDAEDLQRASNRRCAFKIVGLGDSIMYGVGQRKEDTYLEQARRALGRVPAPAGLDRGGPLGLLPALDRLVIGR